MRQYDHLRGQVIESDRGERTALLQIMIHSRSQNFHAASRRIGRRANAGKRGEDVEEPTVEQKRKGVKDALTGGLK